MMLWTRRCVSTSRMLPTTGSGFGPGMSDNGRGVATGGSTVVTVRSWGWRDSSRGLGGGGVRQRVRGLAGVGGRVLGGGRRGGPRPAVMTQQHDDDEEDPGRQDEQARRVV